MQITPNKIVQQKKFIYFSDYNKNKYQKKNVLDLRKSTTGPKIFLLKNNIKSKPMRFGIYYFY